MDDASLASLASVGQDGEFVFTASTALLQTLEVGDVFIAAVSPLTPMGALRKVEGVTPKGAGLALETVQATPQQAFRDLDIEFKQTVRPTQAGLRTQADGLSFPIDLAATDEDGSVEFQGAVSLTPSFELTIDIDIASFSLDELTMEFGGQQTLLADVSGDGEVSFDEALTLGTIPFAPITLPIPYPGGVLPVVFTPRVVIEAGLEGSAAGTFTASINQEASFTAGLGYRDGRFGGFSDSDSTLQFDQPTYDASLSVRASAGPRLEVLLYGAVGPYASVVGYAEASASLAGPPPCATGVLNAGLTAKAGVELLADYETTLLNKVFPLATFDSCSTDPNAPAPAITWARTFGRVGSHGEEARAVVQAADGSYLVVGESTLFDGITGSGASIWAMRLDPLGNVMWQRAYRPTAGAGAARAVAEVPGGFVIATGGGLLAIDTGGNPLWSKTYASGEYLDIASLVADTDGSLMVAGIYGNTQAAWAAQLSPDGDVVWSRRFGGQGFTRVRSTADGGHVLVGTTPSNDQDAYLVKLDAGGGVSWERAIDDKYDLNGGGADEPIVQSGTDYGLDVAQRPDGGYVVVGSSYGAFPNPEQDPAGHFEAWVAEVGPTGDLLGATLHRAPVDAVNDIAQAVAVRPDGSTVVVGRRADQPSDLFEAEDLLVIQDGAYLILGGSGNDTLNRNTDVGNGAVATTLDGGLIVAATSDSFGGENQFWLVKLDRTANIRFGYRDYPVGTSYDNSDAVSLATGTGATAAPISAAEGGAIAAESTALTSAWQLP